MEEEFNPLVGITGLVSISTFIMVVMIGFFIRESAWLIAPVVAFMALLGIFLGYFVSKG